MNIKKRLISKEDPDYSPISDYISSTESVVGIDARHTHIIIIKKLIQLEQRLEKLDKQLAAMKKAKKRK
ncbi:MAG: hypothetical protein OEV74_14950 [Cyclobacteriaceae bacterium]|nr:hypothetical protein [Cyclobacteriaceae bacterium]MDH4297578.1 hypothetical protein [Cyclobacteriaceae bacterium]MDH5249677.1 hypothetical protein [Cyclobacteriaceae bacterium]